MKQIKRFFSSTILPWKFSNSKAYELPSVNESFNLDLLKEKESFLHVYDQILKSYENQDFDWLKEAFEPKLYKKLQSGIQEIKANEQKIKVINENEYTDLTYHNASCIMGVNVDRSKNKNAFKPIESEFTKKARISHVLCQGFENYAILKVYAIYASRKKLLLLDKNDNLIEGNNSNDLEYHMFQFEKMLEFKSIYLATIKIQLWSYFDKKNPFEDSQWIITDVDNSLEGNPILVKE